MPLKSFDKTALNVCGYSINLPALANVARRSVLQGCQTNVYCTRSGFAIGLKNS